ncbi:UDP-glycosyltransferase 74E2 [Heracleum sosnowskyi]|uniref:UDP-glycosyltransferase 74E2 n=1 Tax=Heracleum sosnowskyi TaxID=360622 RepID=A0AAD8N568_9APIA|nr:UDP-glycosyltransferase 74E2 [Heracleum sosnowskyi]
MSWEKMIMLKSSDGLILKVEEAVVLECGALVEFIEKSDESDINAIQIHGVNFSTLGKVMEYCKQQARKEDTESLGAKLVNADPITVFHLVHGYAAVLDVMVNQFLDFDKVDWVLCNTFYKLEEEVIDWMSKQLRLRPNGPTIPRKYLNNEKTGEDDTNNGLQMFKPNIDAWMNWLNEQQEHSVIYALFRSLAELDAVQMQELAYGIKQSRKHFLWIVRASEEGMKVLAHKAIGCFVTHCGWNSTLVALCLGIPIVAILIWTDQRTNTKFDADVWKMGVKVNIDENRVFKETVKHCIREVMDGEKGKEIKRNARRWMEMARGAVKEGGSSDTRMSSLLA